ncbi:MAG: hypothetical protein ACR5KW_01260 [Wolbachia sp.]
MMRPVVAAIFCHICNKYGRRVALLFSIVLITLLILLIAFVSSYQNIEIFALILLICLRLLQDISIIEER